MFIDRLGLSSMNELWKVFENENCIKKSSLFKMNLKVIYQKNIFELVLLLFQIVLKN